MRYNVDIKSLNCGTQLVIPKNMTDIVFCSACGTKCIITGLNVNEELLKKNNLNYMATVKPPEDEARASYINNLKQNKKSIKSTYISDIFHGDFSKAKKNSAAHKEEKNQIQQKINFVNKEPERVKNEFINRKCKLKGIYSKGNDSFKWEIYNPDVPVMTGPFGVNGR